jgi:hypothetical protein
MTILIFVNTLATEDFGAVTAPGRGARKSQAAVRALVRYRRTHRGDGKPRCMGEPHLHRVIALTARAA